MEEKESLDTRVAQLEKERGELLRDNRRMAEMLATSEGDSREVADMLERLSQERRQLRRQCQQLRENGRWGLRPRACDNFAKVYCRYVGMKSGFIPHL